MIVAALPVFAADALACSCAPPGPGRCQLPTAPVAFAARVISRQAFDLRPAVQLDNRGRRLATDPPPPRDDSYIAVTLEVIEQFRGDSSKTIIVRTDPANSSCTYPFEVGHDYLVFAYMKDGSLRTDPCAGTRPVASEIALIHQLRSTRAGTGMPDLFGTIYQQRLNGSIAGLEKSEGAAGVTVTVNSDGREYETVSSADGSYEFWGLAPGKYAINAQPPPRRLISQVYSLNVGSGSACRADFQLSYGGSISGTVVDMQGQPLTGLISADSVDSAGPAAGGSLAASVDQGQFEFKMVPPGHYRLRFWPKVNGRGQSDSFYYPGTRTEAQAAEIEVGDGTHLEGLHFTIP